MVSYDITDGHNVQFTASALRNETYITAKRGGDIQLQFAFPDATNYNQARLYTHNVGAVSTGRTMGGAPWYVETVASDADVTSHVVQVEPKDAGAPIDAFWCVFTDAEDVTTAPAADLRIDFDAVYLAPGSEYVARGDVEADLGANLFG